MLSTKIIKTYGKQKFRKLVVSQQERTSAATTRVETPDMAVNENDEGGQTVIGKMIAMLSPILPNVFTPKAGDVANSEDEFIDSSTPLLNKFRTMNIEDIDQLDGLDSGDEASPLIIKPYNRQRTAPEICSDEDEDGFIKSDEMKQLDDLLKLCNKHSLENFQSFAEDKMKMCRKLAEATFSEAFISQDKRHVFKIVPFGLQEKVNGEDQAEIEHIFQEILITKKLSIIHPSFVKIVDSFIVKGQYPKVLLEQWDSWKADEENDSQNCRPDYFSDQQYFVIIVLLNAGIPLENIKLASADDALDVLKEIIEALAEAEKQYQFEHRDLHWGNILIDVENNLATTIIDYSFSRLFVDGKTIFRQFPSDSFFDGRGDYQFEIYRMMRNELKGDWGAFRPKTNIFWLHYIVDKLLSECLSKRAKNRKILNDLKSRMLQYESVQDLVRQDEMFD